MLQRIVQSLCAATLAIAMLNSAVMVSTAGACPMCGQANESDQAEANRRPQAYMYSILFMMAMPATIFAGFGIGLYRLSRKADASSADGEA